MKKKVLILAITLCIILTTATLFARTTVVSVQGEVSFMDAKTTSWQPLQAGAILQEGTKISTGVRASAVLNMSGNRVTVGSMSMMKIYQNQLVDGMQQTRIGMRRGEMTTDVTGGEGVRTVFRVATPAATSAVRGTTQKISTGPFGTSIVVPKGSVRVDTRNGQKRAISGRLKFDLPKGAMEPRPVLVSSTPSITPAGSTDAENASAELFLDAPQGTGVQVEHRIDVPGDIGVNVGIGFPRK